MANQTSTSLGRYEYPSINGAFLEVIRAERHIKPDFEERISELFRIAVVETCGIAIGKHLRDASYKRKVTGADLGRATGVCRSTVSTWFSKGIYSFDGLILSISELSIEWEKLPCPSLTERTIHGYIEATTHIRRAVLGDTNCEPLKREEWEYLLEASSTEEWPCAVAVGDTKRLEELACRFAAALEKRTGQPPRAHGALTIRKICKDWQEAFQLCLDAIPVQWLECDDDTDTKRPD